MNKKNKIFFIIFGLLLLSSIEMILYRYIYLKQFTVFVSEEKLPTQFDSLGISDN